MSRKELQTKFTIEKNKVNIWKSQPPKAYTHTFFFIHKHQRFFHELRVHLKYLLSFNLSQYLKVKLKIAFFKMHNLI